MLAVQVNGWALDDASDNMKGNIDVFRAAVQQIGHASSYNSSQRINHTMNNS